jgi:hypothetical protein
MDNHRVLLVPEQGHEANDLATWLRRQGFDVSFVAEPETMGSAETLSVAIAGNAALRAMALVAREWIRAHRTRISIRLSNGDSFEVEGTTDIDQLVELMCQSGGEDDA